MKTIQHLEFKIYNSVRVGKASAGVSLGLS